MRRVFGCKDTSDKIGILIAQLGTPDAPTKQALKPYLKQFLSDRRVIEVPQWKWWFILRCFVLPFRPKRSARLYKRIWTEAGSPLRVITERQTDFLAAHFKDMGVEVVHGMRYGTPSLEAGLDELINKRGCTRILLFNMYPQYSAPTSASNYDAVFHHILKRRFVPTLHVVQPYHRYAEYIDALAAVTNEALEKMPEKPEALVLSYHGIPASYIKAGDPYCCMCTETTMLLKQRLKYPADKVIHTYQSRFGKDPWLEPYTDETIERLAKEGLKHIAVACPAFVTDCLETLEEMGNEGRELFCEHGGEKVTLIPCLNDHPIWLKALAKICENEMSPWFNTRAYSCERCECPLPK